MIKMIFHCISYIGFDLLLLIIKTDEYWSISFLKIGSSVLSDIRFIQIKIDQSVHHRGYTIYTTSPLVGVSLQQIAHLLRGLTIFIKICVFSVTKYTRRR